MKYASYNIEVLADWHPDLDHMLGQTWHLQHWKSFVSNENPALERDIEELLDRLQKESIDEVVQRDQEHGLLA